VTAGTNHGYRHSGSFAASAGNAVHFCVADDEVALVESESQCDSGEAVIGVEDRVAIVSQRLKHEGCHSRVRIGDEDAPADFGCAELIVDHGPERHPGVASG